jgi:hypothetical protein
MDQEIRFCTTADGVKLAYAISGESPPTQRRSDGTRSRAAFPPTGSLESGR